MKANNDREWWHDNLRTSVGLALGLFNAYQGAVIRGASMWGVTPKVRARLIKVVTSLRLRQDSIKFSIAALEELIDYLPFLQNFGGSLGDVGAGNVIKTRQWVKGETIQVAGFPAFAVHQLTTGAVMAGVVSEDGFEYRYDVLGAGSRIGVAGLVLTNAPVTYTALEDCQTIRLGYGLAKDWAGRHLVYAVDFLTVLVKRLLGVLVRLDELLYRPAGVRLLRTMGRVAAGFSDDGVIPWQFSHEEWAIMCGSTRVKVRDSIKSYADAGVLVERGRQVRVVGGI